MGLLSQNINRDEKGFTLVEILTAVTIIGILASIAIPTFTSYRSKAYNSSAITYIRTISQAQEVYWTNSQLYISAPAAYGPTASGLLPGEGADDGLGFIIGVYPIEGTDLSTGNNIGASYTAFVGHIKGNQVYATDSNNIIYWRDANASLNPGSDAIAEDATKPIPLTWGNSL